MPISSRYKCIHDVSIVDGQIQSFILCDSNGPFFLRITNVNGVITTDEFEIDGVTPYTSVGTVENCGAQLRDVEQRLFCDDNGGVITPYIVAYEYDDSGAIIGTTTTLIDGITPYVPTGITRVCAGEDGDVEAFNLCDNNDTEFLRHIIYDNTGSVIGTFDTELDGTTVFVPVGAVKSCIRIVQDIEIAGSGIIPNPDDSIQNLTVTDAAVVTFAAWHANTTHIDISFDGGSVYFTDDGSVPSSVNGHTVRAESYGRWRVEKATAAKFIAKTAFDGRVTASPQKPL